MKDPVCGMEVGEKGELFVHNGKEYRFCCATCRWAFEKSPEQFTVMKVQVLTTPDCSNCAVLEKMLEKLGVQYDLIDVTEKPEYLEKYPIFTAPGLIINEKLEFIGIPKIDELEKKLSK